MPKALAIPCPLAPVAPGDTIGWKSWQKSIGHASVARSSTGPRLTSLPHANPEISITISGAKGRTALAENASRNAEATASTYAPRLISDHIMVQEDFERLHKFLVETEGLPEISDDMRELVEEEWPELVHKLPPRVPQSG